MRHEHILLAHGSGGSMMHDLIRDVFHAAFGNPALRHAHDGAMLDNPDGRLAFTTDSYVVQPVIFPGGSIGELAVHGTINDLAMCGARPLALSVGMILEEGLEMALLEDIVGRMKQASEEAGVPIVTGDTKVVERGSCDKIFINTSGIGVVPHGVHIDGAAARPGDAVLLSGNIGEHGVAVMSERKGVRFQTAVRSDTQALHRLVARMFDVTPTIHVLRDPTRGGVATTLNEIAAQSRCGIEIDEERLPITDAVAGACDLLGLEPLFLANEGKLLAIVPEEHADPLLAAMRALPEGADSCRIGRVVADMPGIVRMRTGIGGTRIVSMLTGEMLPRIC
ncbi:MAG: hydrogenase expression/formation protein HypE [Bacteroidota bacterium]|jgi:hydrogenase expression/formation protein HypE|nr:hydrogenase expression/formation protein HypE [Bacteroidota bacterium]